MASRHRQTPSSYDEIVRHTVRNPDLSYRPSWEEERLARHRFGEPTEHRPHPLSEHERALYERVFHALAADPALDLHDVTLDIDDRQVVLTGSAPGPATAIRIEEIAAAVPGVEGVDNQLVIRSHRE